MEFKVSNTMMKYLKGIQEVKKVESFIQYLYIFSQEDD
jgi:hypothetical protein